MKFDVEKYIRCNITFAVACHPECNEGSRSTRDASLSVDSVDSSSLAWQEK